MHDSRRKCLLKRVDWLATFSCSPCSVTGKIAPPFGVKEPRGCSNGFLDNLRDTRHHIPCIEESSTGESRRISQIYASKTLTIVERYGVPGHWLLRLKDDENKGVISKNHGDESVLYNVILRNVYQS